MRFDADTYITLPLSSVCKPCRIFTYPEYCRYRARMRLLGGMHARFNDLAKQRC